MSGLSILSVKLQIAVSEWRPASAHADSQWTLSSVWTPPDNLPAWCSDMLLWDTNLYCSHCLCHFCIVSYLHVFIIIRLDPEVRCGCMLRENNYSVWSDFWERHVLRFCACINLFWVCFLFFCIPSPYLTGPVWADLPQGIVPLQACGLPLVLSWYTCIKGIVYLKLIFHPFATCHFVYLGSIDNFWSM